MRPGRTIAASAVLFAMLLTLPGCGHPRTGSPSALAEPSVPPASAPPSVADVLARLESAYARTKTLTADFVYSVESARRKQRVEGTATLMKPNLARVVFHRMAEPAFPSLLGSDGRTLYTYVPSNFRGGRGPDATPFNALPRLPAATASGDTTQDVHTAPEPAMAARPDAIATFAPADHDPVVAARRASGLERGGQIARAPVAADGRNIRLWDSIALQAFFHPSAALRGLYGDPVNELRIEGRRVVDGVDYLVLHKMFKGGNVEGGSLSDFDQRIFIGPDDLIHRYELRFELDGKPGLQVMQLTRITRDTPVSPQVFAFVPPS